MVVVIHQAISDDGNTAPLRLSFDVFQQEIEVRIVTEDIILMYSAVIDMIVVIWKEKDLSTCHNYPPESASHQT